MNLPDVEKLLQTAVSPAIVVSACGLLLLTMSNRLGRTIDRIRLLNREYTHVTAAQKPIIDAQIVSILHRARLIQSAILFVTLCIFLAVLLVACLFVLPVMGIQSGLLVAILFLASLGSLTIALVFFMREIYQALEATAGEVEHTTNRL
jgi:hypothetical protein